MTIRIAQAPVFVATLCGCLSGTAVSAELGQLPPSPSKSAPTSSNSILTGPAAGSASAHTPPGATGASPVTQSAKHAALVKLLSSPDSTVVTVGGQSITAGQFRNRIKDLAFKSPKTPRPVASRKVPSPTGSDRAAQNSALLSELKQTLAGHQASSQRTSALAPVPHAGTSGDLAARPMAAAASYLKPCSESAPEIRAVKGSLTPGGMVTFEGTCLGNSPGEVRMYGDFANGFVTLQVQMWADGGAAATVPADLAGVLDQTASISVLRADGQGSNARSAAFAAQRQTMQLPASLVQLDSCTDWPTTAQGRRPLTSRSEVTMRILG